MMTRCVFVRLRPPFSSTDLSCCSTSRLDHIVAAARPSHSPHRIYLFSSLHIPTPLLLTTPLLLLRSLLLFSAQVIMPRRDVPSGTELLVRLGDKSVADLPAVKEHRDRFFGDGEEDEGGQDKGEQKLQM